jgi:hypothetical protein
MNQEKKGIKITHTTVSIDGKKNYRIDEIECLPKEKLPARYLEGCPCCCPAILKGPDGSESPIGIVIQTVLPKKGVTGEREIIYIGDVFGEGYMNRFEDLLRQCGERLHRINQEIKEAEAWVGKTETIII